MKTFVRWFCAAVALVAMGSSLTPAASAAPAAPPRSISELGSDLDDLESLLNNLEKNIGTYDEKQRRSVYARLLALAEKIGVGLAAQRQLLNQAISSPPKNDPNGGLTKAATELQKRNLAELNRLDARLKALRARIAALNPDLKPAGGGGGVAGGGPAPAGGTAPVGGTKKK